MQAETLASAYRLWRREWKGRGREYVAGALVWQVSVPPPGQIAVAAPPGLTCLQINDCWPVTSWSIVDYFLRPKPSYFAIARELAAISVGATRKDVTTFADERTAANMRIETRVEIWGSNFTLEEVRAKLEVKVFDLQRDGWTEGWDQDIVLPPNASTELWKGQLPGQEIRTLKSERPKDIVLSMRIVTPAGRVLARYANWCVIHRVARRNPLTRARAGRSRSSTSFSHQSRP